MHSVWFASGFGGHSGGKKEWGVGKEVRNGADGWLRQARRVSLFPRDRDEGLAATANYIYSRVGPLTVSTYN